ncbi:serine/arginine repetitive matrix protein 1-like [Planococcus citri]|uniref:serine/arginine repetitive matrix protein 1-like n=1 Tax=Planococcus citri TaxID=170843 RepID=UPI0031F95FFD
MRRTKITIDRKKIRKTSPTPKVNSKIVCKSSKNNVSRSRKKSPPKSPKSNLSKSPKKYSPTKAPSPYKKNVSFDLRKLDSMSSLSLSSLSFASSSYSSSSSSKSSINLPPIPRKTHSKDRSNSPKNRRSRSPKSPTKKPVFERLSSPNESQLLKQIRRYKIEISDLKSQLKSRKYDVDKWEQAILDEKNRRERDRRDLQTANRQLAEKNR